MADLHIGRFGKLIFVASDIKEDVSITFYAKIESIIIICAGLPNTFVLVIFLCAEGRIADITKKRCHLFPEFALNLRW